MTDPHPHPNPHPLQLRYEACVRTRSLTASCTACRDVCPTGAVTLDGVRGSVVVRTEACTGCGLCAAACPTDAFSAPFDLPAFLVESRGNHHDVRVRCGRDHLPCIGALSAEDFVVLALHMGDAVMVVQGDSSCRSPSGHPLAERRVVEAQRLLTALGVDARIAWAPPPSPSIDEPPRFAPEAPRRERRVEKEDVSASRRRLLRIFAPQLEAAPAASATPATARVITQSEKLDRSRMRTTAERRRRLLAALEPFLLLEEARDTRDTSSTHVSEDALGFLSSKIISEEACTSCSMCINVCPTGALAATRTPGEITFDTRTCVKCHLCHDVCEADAVALAPETSLADFFAMAAPRTLVRVQISHCVDCGMPFKKKPDDDGGRASASASGSGMCTRCDEQDREARELSGVGE